MLFKKRDGIASIPKPRQFNWRYTLVFVIGLAVAAGSWWYLQQYIATHQETEQVSVPAHDIPPYTVITSSDLTLRTIILGAREPNAVLNLQEIAGKVAVSTLYKGEQIRQERLTAPADQNRQIVTVNIDPARVNGVAPGNIVDMYWVQGENAPGAILATDAQVVAVKDAGGGILNEINESSAGVMTATVQAVQAGRGTPAMVMLSVKPEEVPQVVRGAAAGSKGIVLVKKLKPGGTVATPPAAAAPAQGQPTANTPGQQVQKSPR